MDGGRDIRCSSSVMQHLQPMCDPISKKNGSGKRGRKVRNKGRVHASQAPFWDYCVGGRLRAKESGKDEGCWVQNPVFWFEFYR